RAPHEKRDADGDAQRAPRVVVQPRTGERTVALWNQAVVAAAGCGAVEQQSTGATRAMQCPGRPPEQTAMLRAAGRGTQAAFLLHDRHRERSPAHRLRGEPSQADARTGLRHLIAAEPHPSYLGRTSAPVHALDAAASAAPSASTRSTSG